MDQDTWTTCLNASVGVRSPFQAHVLMGHEIPTEEGREA